MTYRSPRPRGTVGRGLAFVEDFMNWLLYGYETWLVALLKGVPLFLYVYFLMTYVPNYAYAFTTQIALSPEASLGLNLSPDVGFLVANGVGGANFTVLVILAVWTQAARGRRGFGWQLIRVIDFLQLLFVLLLLIPLMAFNLAGGSLIPPRFPLQAMGLGTITAGLGAATLVYLYLEYRRITRREAQLAAARSAAYSAG
jgi:hypothetical protein